MLIGQIADLADVVTTIRYHESIGMLPRPNAVPNGNGHDPQPHASVGFMRAAQAAVSLSARSEAPPRRATEARHRGRCLLGNHRLAEETGRCSIDVEAVLDRYECDAKIAVVLMTAEEVIAVVAVADTIHLQVTPIEDMPWQVHELRLTDPSGDDIRVGVEACCHRISSWRSLRSEATSSSRRTRVVGAAETGR